MKRSGFTGLTTRGGRAAPASGVWAAGGVGAAARLSPPPPPPPRGGPGLPPRAPAPRPQGAKRAPRGSPRPAEQVLTRARAASGGDGWTMLRGWHETGHDGPAPYESWYDPL